MTAQVMPRIPFTLRIDDRLIDGFNKAAKKAGLSRNVYMEQLLLGHLKGVGEVPIDMQPLEDSRGGKRQGAGKPKKSKDEAIAPADVDPIVGEGESDS